jgi:prepilin-type N-terminal cleavage/methylation domain-containing protein
MSTSSRRGFTLVELLVVIAIIGALMGLLLPAISAARERARMATCNNNARQLATAMFNYATSGKGTYPGWADDMKVMSGGQVGTLPIPWAAKLLPRLDQQTLWDQLQSANNGAGFPWDSPPKIEVFSCPSDAGTDPKIGTLTYVVNAGMPDLMGTLHQGVASDLKANGMCHDLRAGREGPSVRSGGDVPDGADATILVTENVHKDPMLPNGVRATWLGPLQAQPGPIAGNANYVADMSTNPEQRFGITWIVGDRPPNLPSLEDFQPINRDANPPVASYSNPGGSPSRFARPASEHPDVFIVGFAGGSTKEVRDTIDYRVYQQLMTPNGLKAARPSQPAKYIEQVLQPNQRFMNPPLNAGDY